MTKTRDVVNATLAPAVGIERAVLIVQRDEGALLCSAATGGQPSDDSM